MCYCAHDEGGSITTGKADVLAMSIGTAGIDMIKDTNHCESVLIVIGREQSVKMNYVLRMPNMERSLNFV